MVQQIYSGLLRRIHSIRRKHWHIFENGMNTTTAFQRPLLEMKLSSSLLRCVQWVLQVSWHQKFTMRTKNTMMAKNRGETAVRLSKKQWALMVMSLEGDGRLDGVTIRQAVKMTAVTISGYSPVEIATGRRPPDLFDVEKQFQNGWLQKLKKICQLWHYKGLL